ncbi:histidinol-phosphatase [Jatrophihabitans sp. YIM 134969]
MPDSPWSDDLRVALELADIADAISAARFRADDLVVETKPDLSPVSDADKAVEEAIRAHLAEERPDDAITGEEYGVDPTAGPRRWIVDPIDGTKNYVRGVPVWGTLIGLVDTEAGGPDDTVVGVVSAPALHRRWWAARGAGAYGSVAGGPPRRLRVSGVGALEDASLSYSSLEGWKARGLLDNLVGLTERAWRNRGYGDFWSYMLVAEGVVDMAAEPDLSLWDMAGVVPIVTEAGGTFTDLAGTPGPHGPDAAASNGRLHAALLEALGG